MENPSKMDNLGVPLFFETPISPGNMAPAFQLLPRLGPRGGRRPKFPVSEVQKAPVAGGAMAVTEVTEKLVLNYRFRKYLLGCPWKLGSLVSKLGYNPFTKYHGHPSRGNYWW